MSTESLRFALRVWRWRLISRGRGCCRPSLFRFDQAQPKLNKNYEIKKETLLGLASLVLLLLFEQGTGKDSLRRVQELSLLWLLREGRQNLRSMQT